MITACCAREMAEGTLGDGMGMGCYFAAIRLFAGVLTGRHFDFGQVRSNNGVTSA
jgi:hypothetical protein